MQRLLSAVPINTQIAVAAPELSYNQTYELQWRLAYWVSLYSVDSQLLNCVFDNSRIVIFTIQELWKSQCNNTDINNTDYSDTDPFRSGIVGQEMTGAKKVFDGY